MSEAPDRIELVRITDPGHVLRADVDYYVSGGVLHCWKHKMRLSVVGTSSPCYCRPEDIPAPKPEPRKWRVRDYMATNNNGWAFVTRADSYAMSRYFDKYIPVSDWYEVTEVTDESD